MQWIETISEPVVALTARIVESVPGLVLPGLAVLAAALVIGAIADRVIDRSAGSLAE